MLNSVRFFGSVGAFIGLGATVTPLDARPQDRESSLGEAHECAPFDFAARSLAPFFARRDEARRDIRPCNPAPHDLTPRADACIPADQCCKICSKGKACGNTCIRRSYDCHKGRGCACDADEVCN